MAGSASYPLQFSVFPKELAFALALGSSDSQTVTLENKSDEAAVAFKLQSNSPSRYGVRPANGIIPPLSKVEVTVRLKALETLDVGNGDKFLVRCTTLPADSVSFPSERWKELSKKHVTKYLLKVKFKKGPAQEELNMAKTAPLKVRTSGVVASTPASTTARFSTPQAAPPSMKAANAAAGNLKKLWSERATKKQAVSAESPNAAKRYANAAATMGVAEIIVERNYKSRDANLHSDRENAVRLLIKDGSRLPQDKLSQDELHKLIQYRGTVTDDAWAGWVKEAHERRAAAVDTPAAIRAVAAPPNPPYTNSKFPMARGDSGGSISGSTQKPRAIQRAISGRKKGTPRNSKPAAITDNTPRNIAKRRQIGISKRSPYLENREKNFVAASRRNTVIGRYGSSHGGVHGGVQNRKFPGQSGKKIEQKQALNPDGSMRRPWETAEFDPGVTRSSELRQMVTHSSNAKDPSKSQVVKKWEKEHGAKNRRHSLLKHDVVYGYGVVARPKHSPAPANARLGSSAAQKKTETPRRLQKDVSLSETEKTLMEKLALYEARLDAVEVEKQEMKMKMSKIEEAQTKTVAPEKSGVALLSLSDLTDVDPHALPENGFGNKDKTEFEVAFDTPLGIVIGSKRVIKSVNTNSAAWEKGVRPNDVIIKLGGKDVPLDTGPQDISNAILQQRNQTGWAKLVLQRTVAESQPAAPAEASSDTPLETKALFEARKRVICLESELKKYKGAKKAWDMNAKLKAKANEAIEQYNKMKEERDAALQQANNLQAIVRGMSGTSQIVPSDIRAGFQGVRDSVRECSSAVETVFGQIARDLEVFSQHILSSTTPAARVAAASDMNLFLSSSQLRNSEAAFSPMLHVLCRPVSPDDDAHGSSVVERMGEGRLRLLLGATPKEFSFSKVCQINESGQSIAELSPQLKVSKLLRGHSMCVVVHGECGNGTSVCPVLYGDDSVRQDDGIMKSNVHELFEGLASQPGGDQITVSVTAIECLDNVFRDLLQPVTNAKENPVHDLNRDSEGNVWLSNIVGVEIQNADDFNRVMKISKSRQSLVAPNGQDVLPTRKMQYYLSRGCRPNPRAHVVVTVQLEKLAEDNGSQANGAGATSIFSRLTFVHLAPGGESQDHGSPRNTAVQETLTGVGDVLINFANHNDYIPFRHSKLTRMLEPALPKGNSSAVVIITVSTLDADIIQTNRSLLFGQKLSEVSLEADRYFQKSGARKYGGRTSPWK